MKLINYYTKFIPYLYFISIVACWFTVVNKTQGLTAYPILLLGIPFLWQIIKPSKQLNFVLGITFVCISSYLILAYLFNILNILALLSTIKNALVLGGLFVFLNFIMSLWIIRNSFRKSF